MSDFFSNEKNYFLLREICSKIKLLSSFWISIKCFVFTWIFCYYLIIVFKAILVYQTISCIIMSLTYCKWILSCVINSCFTGWSKKFCPSIIALIFFYLLLFFYLLFVLHLQMIKQKAYLVLENLDQLRNLNTDFVFLLILLVGI